MIFNETQRLKQKSGLVWREVDDGVVIVSPAGGEVRALNNLGSVIWTLLDGSNTAKEIIADLQSRFPTIPEHQLQNDYLIFVESLLERDLLVKTESS